MDTRASRIREFPASFTKLLFTLLIIGIPNLSQARPLDPLSPAELETRLQELAHVHWNGKVKEGSGWVEMGCVKSSVTIEVLHPATGAIREQVMRSYRPNVKKPVPVVIVVPTIEGVTILERSVASQLCDAGFGALIADVNDPVQPPELPSWGLEDRNALTAVRSLRTILDYVETQPKYIKGSVGLMGLSLGGITASLMAGVEPERLPAVVTVVGGGNLPHILTYSTNNRVARLRERRMRHENIDAATYENKLRETVRFDPFFFAPLAKRDSLLVVMAKKDDMVPYVVQREQHEAFGRPKAIVFSDGHIGGLLGLTYLYMDEVIEFLMTRLKMERNMERDMNPHPMTITEAGEPVPPADDEEMTPAPLVEPVIERGL